jgi:predicted amidohydrolase YtcJ
MQIDVAIVNGRVWTGGTAQPEAEALAVCGERIAAVGSSADIERMIGPATRVIDAAGRRVLPGFNDAHVHLLSGGQHLLGLDLRGARSPQEFVGLIARHVAGLEPGQWVTGGCWDHEAWPGGQWPTRQMIDPVSPQNPVLLRRLDGHVSLANSAALRAAGIDDATADPPGGRIVRDAAGSATGLVIDAAEDLVTHGIPAGTTADAERALRAAMRYAASVGVTSVQSISNEAEREALESLRRSGELTLRVRSMIPADDFERLGPEVARDAGDDTMLHRGAVKIFSDGSLGARSALLSQPYDDEPTSCGLAIYSREELCRRVMAVDAAGLQAAVHAIGDQAVSWVLEALAQAQRASGRRGARHRVEHAQVVQPKDRARFAALGVVASVQPSHCTDDMRWVEKRLGRRAVMAYPLRSLLAAGATVAFGTDWYVEPLDPVLTLHAAVTRESPHGDGPAGGWHGAERVSMAEAVALYTRGSAWAEFREHDKGTLAAGKLADAVILSQDAMTAAPERILETKVDATMVGGRVVYQRPAIPPNLRG